MRIWVKVGWFFAKNDVPFPHGFLKDVDILPGDTFEVTYVWYVSDLSEQLSEVEYVQTERTRDGKTFRMSGVALTTEYWLID